MQRTIKMHFTSFVVSITIDS